MQLKAEGQALGKQHLTRTIDVCGTNAPGPENTMNNLNTRILADDRVLAELVRRLVEAFHPERIFLFGSKARGEAGPDGDYDLLVLVGDEAPPERRRSRIAYQALRGTRTAAMY